jgi:hypothetical protein
MIAPVRALNFVFEYEVSWLLYRWILVTLIVGSVYISVFRVSKSRAIAGLLSLVVSINSTIIYFLGDSYVTGTVMAWFFVIGAVLTARPRSLSARGAKFLVGGALIGLILCSNPTGAVVAAAVLLTCYAIEAITQKWSFIELTIVAASAVVGFVVSLGTLLVIGRCLFPELNWYRTVSFYSNILRASDYSTGKITTWISSEYSLLVPVAAMVIVIAVGVLVTGFTNLKHSISLAFVPPICFALIYFQTRGPLFEASYYSAMLWPLALQALAIEFARVARGLGISALKYCGALICASVLLSRIAGEYSKFLEWEDLVSLLISVIVGVMVLRSVLGLDRQRSILVVVAICFPLFQIIQNSRPPATGVVPRQSYSLAFSESPTRDVMERNIAAQEWILDRTKSADRVLVYGDMQNNLVSPAAMQLWGPNAASTGAVPSDWDQQNINTIKPSIIVSYFPATLADRERRKIFMNNLLAGRPLITSPLCRRFKAADVSPIEVCLHRLM